MQRDLRIDFLRALAILLIILAHIDPSNLVFQARAFDVPLMTILMGSSYFISSSRHSDERYGTYLLKRFRRLIIPTWGFLILYFIGIWLFTLVTKDGFPYSFSKMMASFLMSTNHGIGYTWIFLIFFEVAIFLPFLKKMFEKKQSKKFMVGGVVLIALLSWLYDQYSSTFFSTSISVVLGIVAYGLLAYLGMAALKQYKKQNLVLAGVFLLVYIMLGYLHSDFGVETFKFPPELQYVAYGAGISLLLFTVTTIVNKYFEKVNPKWLIWLSKNSLTIYYVHIFAIRVVNRVPYLNRWWETRYLFLVGSSLVLTYIWIKFKNASALNRLFK
ncbi:acyltransferase family protein [Pediococcus acidilactici]|uniref:acyltransferase family protein n=1 Tax=Pediococcus acidilactici TaxID=1254 RepID=UPI00132FAB8F|nr:acyltransferase [Pediococcus acidilactici]KAF0508159.1 acyltransferase family protein [Pediococcus acidilactici]